MNSITDFFNRLHDVDFPYVVLRNWDNLPHSVQYGEHGDLDLLVYDLAHFEEVMVGFITPVYAKPRVQYRIKIGDSFVQADLRHVGDGYYPESFQNALLNHRVLNPAGFYTPEPTHHRIALAYHAVHHKGRISIEYRRWLGDITIDKLANTLKESQIGWEQPEDPTVGTFHSYVKGATGVVSKGDGSVHKKQYRFMEHDLIANENKMLGKLNSPHFPKVLGFSKDGIDIEDCGEPLGEGNIPRDWEQQLKDIVRELKQANIVHRDIRIENIMVKDGVIKLIDFGWAVPVSHREKKAPNLLGYPNKAPWGFDDAFSMGKVIKQVRVKKEEMVVI